MSTEVLVGVPDKELLEALRAGDELVVGRRGVGPAQRVILASTSIEVAGRSPVPAVIVPDEWNQEANSAGPVMAGVDGTERDLAVLDFAFALTSSAATTLVVVHAWEQPSRNLWGGRPGARLDQ